MGKKHKKYKKQQFKRQPTALEKELSLKLSIPLSSLPRFSHSEASSSECKSQSQSDLSYKIQIPKADLSVFVIPKRKEGGHDIDPSLQGIKLHTKKHKKKKHHHHGNRIEPIHIAKSHDSQTSQSDSSQSVEKHSSPHHSSANSPLRKLSIVIPKLSSSPIPTSSPLLTYNPVQIPPVEVHPDNDSDITKRNVSTSQSKQSATTDITSKASTYHQGISSEQCSTSVINELAASEELQKLKTNVKYVLKTLQYQLEKKDPQGIFAEPVTDDIAPGYSALISNPMDFSTMAKKTDTLQYRSIDEYKEDFLLMCNNCMTYNPEDTVFYQAAKKLLSSGLKLIAKEAAKKTDLLMIPAVASVNNYSRSSTPLSFQAPYSKRSISPAPSSTREHSSTAPTLTTRSQSNGNSLVCRIPLSLLHRHGIGVTASSNIAASALTNTSLVSGIIDGDMATTSLSTTAQWVADTMSAAAAPPYDDTGMTKLHVGWSSDSSEDSSDEDEYDDVLEQVRAAAAAAHEAVTNKEAIDLAYLDTSEAGIARLNILNPDGGVARDIRNVDMTELEAAIAEGEEANKKLELEHSRHKTTPVAYLMYGPYGAFAPYFDSSFATLTRMDSSLLYSVYGDDMGVTYAHSLQRFVRGTSSFACEMAEAILNGLTSNKHRLLKEKLTEQRDKLFHISQQQKQEQEDKVSENDGKDHQAAATAATTATTADGGEDVKEKDSVVSTTAETTIANITNTTATTTVTTSAVGSSSSSSSTATTAAAATAVCSQADNEKLPQPVLDKNVEILLQLQQLQNERFSRPPFTVPQSQETATALQVAENLKQLTSKVTPGDVASVQALQNAMGIAVTASNSVTTPHSNNT